jgi:hypothetical protein
MTDLTEAKLLVEARERLAREHEADGEIGWAACVRDPSFHTESLAAQLRAISAALRENEALREGLKPFADAVHGAGTLGERIGLAEPANKDWRRARALLGD